MGDRATTEKKVKKMEKVQRGAFFDYVVNEARIAKGDVVQVMDAIEKAAKKADGTISVAGYCTIEFH